jgi:indolepyruvate ferredoxin oxidoreductase alpha subunit
MQEHPATGFTLQGEKAQSVDLYSLVKTLGIDNIRIVDPYDLQSVRSALKEELSRSGPSVIISRRSCVLFKRDKAALRKPLQTYPDKCTGCRLCLGLGCPALAWRSLDIDDVDNGAAKKNKGIAVIDKNLCNACGLCCQLCKFGAITEDKQ